MSAFVDNLTLSRVLGQLALSLGRGAATTAGYHGANALFGGGGGRRRSQFEQQRELSAIRREENAAHKAFAVAKQRVLTLSRRYGFEKGVSTVRLDDTPVEGWADWEDALKQEKAAYDKLHSARQAREEAGGRPSRFYDKDQRRYARDYRRQSRLRRYARQSPRARVSKRYRKGWGRRN